MEHHGAGLRRELVKAGVQAAEEVVAALRRDYREAELEAADRVMLAYCEKLTHAPGQMLAEDVMHLRKAGFDDRGIHDICTVAAYFNFVNRIADGLGVDLEERFSSGS